MAQNIYDDPEFFARYGALPRSRDGLKAAYEWPCFRAMLPPLTGKHVLDLGCGYGALCRRLREMGAASVWGIDISERMLAEARTRTSDPAISYRRSAIESLDMEGEPFDVAVSSLAFHYVEHFEPVVTAVSALLKPGGVFAFSVEHPMVTARAAQDWCRDDSGTFRHWPVDHYKVEGLRQTNWLGSPVIKYHRSVETYVNTLIGAGFRIEGLFEPVPGADFLAAHGLSVDEQRRPLFLLIAASWS